MWTLDLKMKLMKMNSKNEMNRTWENLITNMPKEAIDKQIESKVVVLCSFQWPLACLCEQDTGDRKCLLAGVQSDRIDKQVDQQASCSQAYNKQGVMVMVEAYMLVDRIQTISASIINRKLASYLWLRNREDVREKLLRSLRVVVWRRRRVSLWGSVRPG